MRVVDLHPEDLLERDARGALSDAERERLEVHLARCAACRLERALRDDFADELGAEPTPSELLTLAGAAQPRPPAQAPQAAPEATPRTPSRRSARRVTWLLVAAAVLAVSAAGATGAGRRVWTKIVEATGTVDTEAAEAPAAPAPKHPAHRLPPSPAKAPLPPPDESATALAAETPTAPPAPPALTVSSPPPAIAGVARVTSSRPPSIAPEPASALFGAAAEARRHGDYARAVSLHHDLVARFPSSREAHVSRATTGRLLLDRGDPAGALAQFDAYLTSGSGDLGEEAMVGRALARTDDAGRAWRALLAAYPETPFGAHARARLGGSSVR
jgi:TolA-binding protein